MGNKYVLIVDDDPDMVETVGMMLESKGYEVGKAYDGVEGEESIKQRRPDLVVLDVMMPRKNGYVLCAELKKNKETRDIPIVLLTAVGEAVPTTSYFASSSVFWWMPFKSGVAAMRQSVLSCAGSR